MPGACSRCLCPLPLRIQGSDAYKHYSADPASRYNGFQDRMLAGWSGGVRRASVLRDSTTSGAGFGLRASSRFSARFSARSSRAGSVASRADAAAANSSRSRAPSVEEGSEVSEGDELARTATMRQGQVVSGNL